MKNKQSKPSVLLVPDSVKTVEDFKKWLSPESDKYHPLNINVTHAKHQCRAFNFHENQAQPDGNMYYHVQSKDNFLKCKIKSLNKVFKFTYQGTDTAERPSEEIIKNQ